MKPQLTETTAWRMLDVLLSPAVVEALEALYPPRCIGPEETLDDHLRYAGKVDLVRSLAQRLEVNGERPIKVDASDPNSIKGLAQTDVPTLSSEPASAATGPAAQPGSSAPASATARATYARQSQTPRRGGRW